MKKLIFLPILFLCFGITAQPVFNVQGLLSPSSILYTKKNQILGTIPITGTNLQWDFTYLRNDYEPGLVIGLSNITDFPFMNVPEGTNKILVKINSFELPPDDQLFYYRADSNGFTKLSVKVNEPSNTYVPYTEPYQELIFPLTYQPDQVISNYSYTITERGILVPQDSIRTHRQSTVYTNVPGWGTITLPFGMSLESEGSYEVLAIQRLETGVDSIEIWQNGQWQFLGNEIFESESIDFLSPDKGYYVMSCQYVYNEKESYYNVSFVNDDIIIGNPELTNQTIQIFPNPACDQIFISGIDANTTVQLTDLNGRIIKEWKSLNSSELNLPSLSNGVYFVRLQFKGESHNRKLIIQN